MPDDGDLAHILGVVDHMLEEKLRDRGGEKALFHGDADLARLLDVERQRRDAVASGLDEQAVHDADAKSRLDHGQEREVARRVIGDLGMDVVMVEQTVEFVVFDLHQAHEVLVRQLLEREDGRVRHWVILWENGDHRVVQDGRRLKVVGTLLIFLTIAGIPLKKWWKFVTPLISILFVVCVIALIVATKINYGPF